MVLESICALAVRGLGLENAGPTTFKKDLENIGYRLQRISKNGWIWTQIFQTPCGFVPS